MYFVLLFSDESACCTNRREVLRSAGCQKMREVFIGERALCVRSTLYGVPRRVEECEAEPPETKAGLVGSWNWISANGTTGTAVGVVCCSEPGSRRVEVASGLVLAGLGRCLAC